MFPIFPEGWPGAGLLLLRAACGVVLITQGGALLEHRLELGFAGWAVFFAVIVVGSLLLIGLQTRLAALAGAVISLTSFFSLVSGLHAGPLGVRMTAILSAVIAAAVICIGPGAISLDARLFGRREIIIPARSSDT